MTPTMARRMLVGLAALAGFELVLSAWTYRDAIDDADWVALADTLADDDAQAMRLATAWLGPRARMEVPQLADASAVAAPDLRGVETLTVVGLGETWSEALDLELEGARRPDRISREDVGPFTVIRYRFDGTPKTLQDWVTQPPELSTPRGPCRKKALGFTCPQGRVVPKFAEIDHAPRRCLSVSLDDGTPLTFHDPAMQLGRTLRGHVGVADFNARLRSDAPIRVQAWIDDTPVGTFIVTDAQGWRPFEIHTEPGEHDVRVVVTDTVRGTWGRRGYDPRPTRSVCFELRSLDGAP